MALRPNGRVLAQIRSDSTLPTQSYGGPSSQGGDRWQIGVLQTTPGRPNPERPERVIRLPPGARIPRLRVDCTAPALGGAMRMPADGPPDPLKGEPTHRTGADVPKLWAAACCAVRLDER